ncbi:MAG TPA: ADP-glyceromanno-heptose 6-epimerase [Acidiferrobacter sp.]|nr:ADP-glyceromanno-heptose 6-epimerase [Acidiferrobacter sp.]
MIVVTGGAGFIGANIVKGLNDRGYDDILVVDNLEHGDKFLNLTDCEIADYRDKRDFIAELGKGRYAGRIQAIFHEGACSDTMNHDGLYMMQNNYEYSKTLLGFCENEGAQFLYASSASVYGAGHVFQEQRDLESPLNVYGYSKFLFDQYVRRRTQTTCQVVGFRYFNVYGPREQHKGRMASVAYHFFHQYQATGQVRLFDGNAGYAPGEQRRDFVSVEDVVKINLYFLDHPERSGIYNLGTGHAQSFNDVAVATVNAVRRAKGEEALGLAALQGEGVVSYIPFPEALVGKYQSFTEANVGALRAIGYKDPLYSVEQGVSRYVDHLLQAQKSV